MNRVSLTIDVFFLIGAGVLTYLALTGATGTWELFLVGAAVLVLLVLFDWACYAVEWIRPLEYWDVAFDELEDHFGELYRRGDVDTQMVVTDDRSGKSVRLRKYFKVYQPTSLDLLADHVSRGDLIPPDALRALKELGIECRWGIPRERLGFLQEAWQKYPKNLVCPCGDSPKIAAKAAEIVFRRIYLLPPDSPLKVRVKGGIAWDERVIDSTVTVSNALFIGPPARPYKQWQREQISYRIGGYVGAIARKISEVLFPPRGPGGGLAL